MNEEILKQDKRCEVCGHMIHAGEAAIVRRDYDWDNPNEDKQGSFLLSFYRHANREVCQKWIEVNRTGAKIKGQFEEDEFRKATH